MPAMLEGLGKFWATDTLTIKTYPGCHYFQTSLAALEEIRRKRPEADVKSVYIETTKFAIEATRFAREMKGAANAPMSHIGVSFDLALAAAVLLHAGRISAVELDDEYLEENRAQIERWLSKIRVDHDPVLTAKTVASVRGIDAGERSLRSLKVTDLFRIARRYREEYGSTLLSAGDAFGSLGKLIRRHQGAAPCTTRLTGAPPLYFPGRVTVGYADGSTETVQIDLPPGSLANAAMEGELKRKFLREVAPNRGEADACALFNSVLGREEHSIDLFVRGSTVVAKTPS
jgi:2-methylcitrate dehydratase PrpD